MIRSFFARFFHEQLKFLVFKELGNKNEHKELSMENNNTRSRWSIINIFICLKKIILFKWLVIINHPDDLEFNKFTYNANYDVNDI